MRILGVQDITVKDVLISVLILTVTFGYFFDSYIREGITEVNFLGFDVGSFGFEDIASAIYVTKMKLLIIAFSLIWFFTCRHWWKSTILVIITIELLKIISILNSNQEYLDEIEFITSLPITIPIILVIIFLSNRISNHNMASDLLIKLDSKINEEFFKLNKEKKQEIEILKDNFIMLKKNKKIKQNEITYLNELIEIRNKFFNI